MDIRRFFSGQPTKTNNAGSSKTNGAKPSNTKDVGKNDKNKAKGREKKRKSSSKTSESDETPVKERKKPKQRKKAKNALDSDSEEDPLPSKLRKTSSDISKNKSDVEVIVSSDEESVLPKRLGNQAKTKNDSKKKTNEVKESPAKVVKNVSEYFGQKPVERSFKSHATKRKKRSDDNAVETSGKNEDRKDVSKSEDKSVEDEVFHDQPTKKAKTSDTKLDKKATSPSKTLIKAKISPTKLTDKAEKLSGKSPMKSERANKDERKQSVKETVIITPVKAKKDGQIITPKKATPEKATSTSDVVPSSLERKASGYRNFMSREGPKALGSKEIPRGSETCLNGLVFVITGVLESIERDDAQELVRRHGGKVTQSISKKTSYIVVGRDAGESKIEKAKKVGTKQIDEDGLFDMIRKSIKTETPETTKPEHSTTTLRKSVNGSQASEDFSQKQDSQTSVTSFSQNHSQTSTISSACSTPSTQTPTTSPLQKDVASDGLLWVDRYSPKRLKDIIGQHGDKSNVNKLLRWLQNWKKNRKAGKSKTNIFAAKEDGSILKAALLSGPPGVGKTTSAQMVCKELGYTYVEFNASDSRSKKTLEQLVSEVLGNKTIDGFLSNNKVVKSSSDNHVLLMDEVDGMAGNEDRGGMQELINLIKSTKIPIICMCNDRNSQKVRSLGNYCFDLRFHRPRVEQIKGAMMRVAFKENLEISPQAMEKIVIGANQDIRQVLYNLCMWTSKQKSINYDEAKQDSEKAQKDIKIGPFDVTRKIFSSSESSKLNMQEYFSLFFNDYSLMPLFSQENYLQVVPYNARGDIKKILKCASQAADSFCDSDLVDRSIRSNGCWNLLPLQSFFSCVLPGKIMKGGMSQKINFPSWLGKNSTTSKNSRILQDLVAHTVLSISGNKNKLNLEYLPHLKRALTQPLLQANSENCSSKVFEVIKLMDNYNLIKEDWESIIEIGSFGGQEKIQSKIDSKVKSAFTRTYNKESHMAPYALQTTAKKNRGKAATQEDDGIENDEDMESSEEETIDKNPMIKMKKTGKTSAGKGKKSGETSTKSKTSRGKGKSK